MEAKKRQIDELVVQQNVPNILLHGPDMNGKEELCKYFMHLIYDNHHDYQKYVMEINCLQTNGIQHMKQNIKVFSMQIVQKTNKISFKTVLLRHAEHLTHDAQYSLRRNIETYSHNTRFVILCENKRKLLSPICSRFVHVYVNIPFQKKIINDLESFRYKKYNELMTKYDHYVDTNQPLPCYATLAKELYLHHFCAYDILLRFKKHPRFHEAYYLFEKYRIEYNNEQLCILFILNVFRSKSEIQIFST